tara:strand:- start:674 stop:1213 length:540 start_codon:yes stop_codon:yes gene_type:complete
MAGGGDSVPVAPHDLAIIVGAIGLVGAIGISMFASLYIPPIDFGEDSSTQQVRSISIGIFGSNDDIVIQGTPVCEGNDTCTMNLVRILDEDGLELSSNGVFEFEEDGSFTTTEEVGEGGKMIVEINAQGNWEIEVTAQRQIPIQFLPSLFSAFLLVWGIWRKMQEGPEDLDIEEIVNSS